MKRNFCRYLALCLVIVSLQVMSFAQLNEQGYWKSDLYYEDSFVNYKYYSEIYFKNALEKLKKAKLENQESIDEWTGDYLTDDINLSASALRWSPKEGFVYVGFYTCIPELRFLNYGSVKVSEKSILMNSEIGKNFYWGNKFLRVKWGERHYLISEGQIADFYNLVAGYGWKENGESSEHFLLKKGDKDKRVTGMPVFPRGYEKFVRKPIEGKITEIIRREVNSKKYDNGNISYKSRTFVEINVGKIQGLRRDLYLYLIDSEDDEVIEIKRIGRNSSIGVIERTLDDNKRETYTDYKINQVKDYPIITVGLKFSTRNF